jgi:hypothetical protein
MSAMIQYRPDRIIPRLVLTLLVASAIAGCRSSGSSQASGGSGMSIGDRLLYGTFANTPAPAPKTDEKEIDCPPVDMLPGGAFRQVGGDSGSQSVRYQYTISDVARECRAAGTSIAFKIGVQGRVILGPQGAPGTFQVPVRFEARRGDKVVAQRVETVSVTVPAGSTSAAFTVVSQELTAPPGPDELFFATGISSGSQATTRRRR